MLGYAVLFDRGHYYKCPNSSQGKYEISHKDVSQMSDGNNETRVSPQDMNNVDMLISALDLKHSQQSDRKLLRGFPKLLATDVPLIYYKCPNFVCVLCTLITYGAMILLSQ